MEKNWKYPFGFYSCIVQLENNEINRGEVEEEEKQEREPGRGEV